MIMAFLQSAEPPKETRADARQRAAAILAGHHGVIDSLTDAQLAAAAAMPAADGHEIGIPPAAPAR